MATTALPFAQLSSIVLIIWLVSHAKSDFASDQNECGAQLLSLATCLPYVQGQAKTPTPDCCTGLKQVLAKSRKCLCVLIKDRNDPDLGLNINATLALRLPGACGSAVNATECIDLLHLPPNSADAKMFKQFASAAEGNITNSTTSGSKGATANSSGSSTVVAGTLSTRSDSRGGSGQAWWARDMTVGLLLWCFTCILLIDS
ncbi:hypothetical protein ACLOJK_021054 [Asimina triloba]